MPTSVAVLGAGNGGLAAAADLTLRGVEVRLYSRRMQSLEPIRSAGGIRIDGAAGSGLAEVATLTDDLGAAVAGADLVMLVVPATALAGYAAGLAGVLGDGQPVFLNPGGTGGALAFTTELRRSGFRGEPCVCEGSTLTYACRRQDPTSVTISNVAPAVPFAAFPGKGGEELHAVVAQLYPAVALRGSVLDTGLVNINAVEHPAQVLLNTGWIEHTRGDFYFYREGTTESVGRVIDEVDRERLAIAEALGVTVPTFAEIFHQAGYTTAEAAATGSAHACLQASEANWWFRAPSTMDHRYVHEDVGFGLVPWAGWARLVGVSTPTIDALVTIASATAGRDYAQEGLTMERMGLAGVDAAELDDLLQSGGMR
ncbi:NAD/NADP octopine/nopaline dehydrogenase family protein [Pseudonocardia sp. T1-2H]|jgi:opine dehydrogenase|uniref:NAD/NADP octopine/nopaline dehydrogenase family protein n=1 Tax=Pseudonocardia sp. T1-2H TaxID=3128899 RepID=UPI003101AD8D